MDDREEGQILEHETSDLKAQVSECQGNLWQWTGVDPYQRSPLKILGLENKERLTAHQIKAAVKQLVSRSTHDAAEQAEVGEGDDLAAPGRLLDLLLRPVTRVVCELQRIPPLALSKEESTELDRLAKELAHDKADLPWPEKADLDAPQIVELFWNHLRSGLDESRLEIAPMPELRDELDLERPGYTGISFRPRERRLITP